MLSHRLNFPWLILFPRDALPVMELLPGRVPRTVCVVGFDTSLSITHVINLASLCTRASLISLLLLSFHLAHWFSAHCRSEACLDLISARIDYIVDELSPQRIQMAQAQGNKVDQPVHWLVVLCMYFSWYWLFYLVVYLAGKPLCVSIATLT